MPLGDTINSIADNPELRDVYESNVEGLLSSMNIDGITFSQSFKDIIAPSRRSEPQSSGSFFNDYTVDLNTMFDTDNFQYNIDISVNLLEYLEDIKAQNSNSYFYSKITSTNTDDIEKRAFEILYYSFKNIKKIKTDISNNIEIGHTLSNRLQHYTSTNPNLHLLSKTKNKLQNKIDNYEKHMNIDTKKNKELETSIKNNKNYNYYLIIIYYVVLILFFMFSNFIKNKYYKNIVALIMIILYIIAPFIIKYIIYYVYKLWLHLLKKYNLLTPNLTYEDIIKYDSYNYENNQENISYI